MDALRRLVADAETGSLAVESVDRALRAAHSIKTEAGFLELPDIVRSSHRMEECLSGIRRNEGALDAAVAAEVRRAWSQLEQSLSAYLEKVDRAATPRAAGTGDGRPPEPSAQSTLRAMVNEARQRGEHAFRIRVRLRTPQPLRYARAFLVVSNLELSSAVLDVDPDPTELRDSDADVLTLLVTTTSGEEGLRRALHIDEVEILDVSRQSYEEIATRMEVRPSSADEASGVQDGEAAGAWRDEVALLADEIHFAARALTASGASPADDDRIAFRRLQAISALLRERMSRAAQVQLLDTVRSLAPSSGKYAASRGKRVHIEVSGSGALVSPAVADTLSEVFLHLFRNSIDHGMEPAAARARHGRPPTGRISVVVERSGDRVEVRVDDDGVGVDEPKVRARVAEQHEPLLEILARPGFSTRTAAAGESGRGVGLDTVVHIVRDLLAGEITIQNRQGVGFAVTLTAAVNARLITVLVVDTADGPVAIPELMIREHGRLETGRVRRDSLGGLFYTVEERNVPLTTVHGQVVSASTLPAHAIVLLIGAPRVRTALVVRSIVERTAVVRQEMRPDRVYARPIGREIELLALPGIDVR